MSALNPHNCGQGNHYPGPVFTPNESREPVDPNCPRRHVKDVAGDHGDGYRSPLCLRSKTPVEDVSFSIGCVWSGSMWRVYVQRKVVLKVAKEIGPAHRRIVRRKCAVSKKVIHKLIFPLPIVNNSY